MRYKYQNVKKVTNFTGFLYIIDLFLASLQTRIANQKNNGTRAKVVRLRIFRSV